MGVVGLHSLAAFALTVDAPAPGRAGRENVVRVHGAAPGLPVVLLGFLSPPGTIVPSTTCVSDGGTGVRIGAPVVPDAAGDAEVGFVAPGSLEGRTTWLQAVQAATCDVSPAVQVDWPAHLARNLGTADVRLRGENSDDLAGKSVAGGGDANGDGVPDLLIGTGGNDVGAYLVHGRANWGDGEADLGTADAKLYGEAPRDDAGYVSFAGDTDGDGFDDLLVGAPHADLDRGKVYLIRGPVTGPHDLGSADARLQGPLSALLGKSVANAGDTDGDGFDDFVLGAPGTLQLGAAFLVRGPISGDLDVVAVAAARIRGDSHFGNAGEMVAGGEDVDGDGVPDLLIGAPFTTTGFGYDSGAAYLVSGTVSGNLFLSDADVRLTGAHAGDSAGYGVGLADLTGDGSADLVIGVATQKDVLPGSVHVVPYRGPVDAPVDAVSDATIKAEVFPNAWSVSRAGGDVDGDGFDDLLLGVQQQDVAYVVLGPIQGTLGLGDADVRLVAEQPGDNAGTDVASAGDVDGDGLHDILVGAYGYGGGGDNRGSAYLIFGSSW